MMDLSNIEGLTDAQREAITAAHEADVTGLKGKNSELLGKFEGFKSEAEKNAEAIEEARQATLAATEAKLLAEGKYEEAQTLREKERADLVAQANTEAEKARNMLKQRDMKDVHFAILDKCSDALKPAAQAMLNNMTDITYADDGSAQVSIKAGEREFNNTSDFMEYAQTDATWSSMLKAPDTKGLDVYSSTVKDGNSSSLVSTATSNYLATTKL